MKKYVVKRSEIYAGCLMKDLNATCVVTDQMGRNITEEELKEKGVDFFTLSCGLVCRGMLFKIKDNVSEDLIYTTPSPYALEGLTSSVVTPSDYKIKDWCNMEEILKYLGYGEELTQRELKKIFKKLICRNDWLENNIKLFGWEKGKLGYYGGGQAVLPIEVYFKLSRISCVQDGNPYKEEPGFALIKRKRG